MAKECEVDDCYRPRHAKGLCQSHYKRGREAKIKTARFKDRPEFAEAERLLGLGLTFDEVAKLTGTDRWTISRNFPDRPGAAARMDKYWELLPYIRAGVSLNEIRITTGTDYRTVRKYFPHYRPFDVGGGGQASSVRETNRRLREFLRSGKIQENKDSGFNTRGRMG